MDTQGVFQVEFFSIELGPSYATVLVDQYDYHCAILKTLWLDPSNGAASASEGISIADKMEAAEHGMEMLKLCDKLHPGLSVERGAILLSMATMLQQTLSQEIMNRISHSESSDDSDPESPGCGGELSERQVYAIFRDSQFCFEEAKKVRPSLPKNPICY